MATYTVPAATDQTQSLPVPTTDAWVMPINGDIALMEAPFSASQAWPLENGRAYAVTAGKQMQYRTRHSRPGETVAVRMWDK